MSRTGSRLTFLLAGLLALSLSGCSYFNTYYNLKRRFAEAERETQTRQGTPVPPGQGQPGQPPGQRQVPPSVPLDKYRKVIEAGSKLLEYYPKSRWVDDALLLMGVAYFRMADYPRADRKFTEIITLFPESRHVSDAAVWRARVLAEQKKTDEAIELLRSAVERLKEPSKRAEAAFLLGSFLFNSEKWSDAAEQFGDAARLPQSRNQRSNALYYLGLSQYEQRAYGEAKEAFAQVIRVSRDRTQSYNSQVYSARCAAALGNNDEAREILTRIAESENFLDFAADTRLELAALAIRSGEIEEGAERYQEFLEHSTDNERRGIAFYRLALVKRDNLHDLLSAKALLDSVVRSGARREIADSARAALDNLSRGLLSIERIRLLRAQIDSLESSAPSDTVGEAQADSAVSDTIVTRPEPDTPDTLSLLIQSSSALSKSESTPPITSEERGAPEFGDTIRATSPADTFARSSPDSTRGVLANPPVDTAGSAIRTPAMVLSDSIADLVRRALRQADSLKAARESAAKSGADTTKDRVPEAGKAPRVPAVNGIQEWKTKLSTARYQLQAAYLHTAEFFNFTLADDDSAMHYYRLAASSNLNSEVHWKANLFLAIQFLELGDTSLARQHFETVVNGDSVPIEASNQARAALGLPLLEEPPSPQAKALQEAEAARDTGAPAESLVVLYDRVAQFGVNTPEGRISLIAKGHLYEYELKNMDSARAVYELIISAYPDSSFSDVFRGKLQLPDTASIFNLSEEELEKRIRPQAVVFEEKPDSTGWPPPEESLRGRRFH